MTVASASVQPAREVPPRPLLSVSSFLRDLQTLVGKRLGFLAAMLIASALLELVSLALLGSLFHAAGLGAAATKTSWLVWPLGLGAALAGLLGTRALQSALRLLSQRIQTRLETDFTASLRTRYYRAAMGADWLFLTRERASDLTQAQLEELPRAGLSLQHFLGLSTVGAVATVQVGVALALSPRLTLGVLAAGALAALGLRTWQRRQHRLQSQMPTQRANLAAAVTEHLGGLKIAKSYGRTEAHIGQFSALLSELSGLLVRVQDRGAQMRFWVEVTTLATLGAFAWVALLWHPVGLGPLLLLGFLFSRLLAQASQLHTSWQQLSISLLSYSATESRRARYLAAAEAPDLAQDRLSLAQELRFERVSFSYQPDREPALAEIDLTLPARSVTALCGRSGAGKSTFADLALGLLRPASGQVWLDGAPLEGSRLHAWRRAIGYVPQETFLFHDTVRANLLWANPDASEADLAAALHSAAAQDFVTRLPQGLDTVIGDRGQRLSGGERQRLALARALLRRPALLVLDEATSSLDPQNERFVQEALERLHGETTILLIAHRLSTVRAADRIVVLESGRIAETGTWDELAAREHGAFRALLAADARA